jgi:MFS superfamily sulfate permease-like transporter
MFLVKNLIQDFRASIVVYLVALPLCLGIALASGAPLLSGILAGIVGGIVVGVFSNSHTSVSGPAAGLTVIVFSAIATLGNFRDFTLAVLLCGVLQLIFGFLKGGLAGGYFPNSVIKGMLAAIGIILVLKQIPHAVGYDANAIGDDSFSNPDGLNTFSELLMAFDRFHPGAVIISFTAFVLILFWDKMAKAGNTFFKLIPGPLIAVIVGVSLNEIFKVSNPLLIIPQDNLVRIPIGNEISALFKAIELPNWAAISNPAVWTTALTLAIVASLESLLSVEAIEKIDPKRRFANKNQELKAQGMGNILCGLLGGLPVTAVIVRSSANLNAGAHSKLSTILHGVWLLISCLIFARLLELIPLAVLAAILIHVGMKLAPIRSFKEMYKNGWSQIIPYVVTISAILLTDLLVGIGIGIIVGLFFVIRSNHHKAIIMVSEGNDYLLRFIKDVSFLQRPMLYHFLSQIPENADVVIDGSNQIFIDDDIISVLQDFMVNASEKNIKIELIKSSLSLNDLFKKV